MEKVRVSKLMSAQGLCSRREADSYIERGWVLVDGVPVTELGTRIYPTQTITLAKAAQTRQNDSVTILLNKPIGFVSGLKGFTAAVIGGIGSIPGAMAGGLILGFAESYTQGYVSTKWSDLVVFTILIAFMIFRPQGLLGRADIRKV